MSTLQLVGLHVVCNWIQTYEETSFLGIVLVLFKKEIYRYVWNFQKFWSHRKKFSSFYLRQFLIKNYNIKTQAMKTHLLLPVSPFSSLGAQHSQPFLLTSLSHSAWEGVAGTKQPSVAGRELGVEPPRSHPLSAIRLQHCCAHLWAKGGI